MLTTSCMHSASDVFSLEALYTVWEENSIFFLSPFTAILIVKFSFLSDHLFPKRPIAMRNFEGTLHLVEPKWFFFYALHPDVSCYYSCHWSRRRCNCSFLKNHKSLQKQGTGLLSKGINAWKQGSTCTGGRETGSPHVQAPKDTLPIRHSDKRCDRWTGMITLKIWVRGAKSKRCMWS